MTSTPTLAGTVASHQCYILLHTPQSPQEFPAKISTAVQRALQLRVGRWGAIVNLAWSPEQPVHQSDDTYYATAFSARGRLELPSVSLDNIEDVESRLKEHLLGPPTATDDIHLYVCTHGQRDCRCGDTGGAVVAALREEVQKRSLERVKIGEVGHIGGHKYAANLLVFPHGEWLGFLKPEDVPKTLDAILERPSRPLMPDDTPILVQNWRGRMGLGKEEQISLYNSHRTDS
ncbi:hypothetical protein PLICRDRAFT_116041 [Plicaturopsis crispa FD-325 SS-3]|nr:hypothetical protein PLICRDRAFT_116041 [Plicaturopsis crispa FD-325 SS-3]